MSGQGAAKAACQKLIVGCDGSTATSLVGDYKGTPFKELKTPELRDFGKGNPNYIAKQKQFSIRNAYPTNIYRILEALEDKDKDGNEQLCQYFPGVATVTVPDNEALAVLLRAMYLTTGVEVTQRITETYVWLCSAYNPNSSVKKKIIFIGWSRGAFTARAVAGMVARYGILRAKDGDYKSKPFKGLVDQLRATYFKQNVEMAGVASKIQWMPEDDKLAVPNYKALRNFEPADIEAYACWETVGSYGVPLSTWHKEVINHPLCTSVMNTIKETLRRWGVDLDRPMTFEHFYDQSLPKGARFAFHALALNEYMEPFRPTLWEKPNANQKLVQCWFPGDHIDSGAGGRDRQIPDITLAWMMTQMEKNGVLKFKPNYIGTAFKESQEITKKEKYAIQKWGHGETTSMYNLISGAAGRLAIGSVMGSKPRDPGNYHRLNPDGTRSSDLLQNTGECIHKSVGVRLKAKTGLAANGKDDYVPKALDNWSVPASEGKYKWNHWSSHTPAYLKEPALEGYEKEMFRLYEDAAGKAATAATSV